MREIESQREREREKGSRVQLNQKREKRIDELKSDFSR